MRNVRIEEVMNGWKVFVPSHESNPSWVSSGTTITLTGPVYISSSSGEYVFTDWDEMMEFIADYFAEEEE